MKQLFDIFVVCKHSYVMYACGFDRMENDWDSQNQWEQYNSHESSQIDMSSSLQQCIICENS